MATVKPIVVLEFVEEIEVMEGTTKAVLCTGKLLDFLPGAVTVKDVNFWGLLIVVLKVKNVVVP
jgi:hypothetical protein